MQKYIDSEKDISIKDNVVLEFKKRMLEWPNPVEYVNNMYGCHPFEEEIDYFEVVFRNENG